MAKGTGLQTFTVGAPPVFRVPKINLKTSVPGVWALKAKIFFGTERSFQGAGMQVPDHPPLGSWQPLVMPGLIRQADWACLYGETLHFGRQPRRILGPGTYALQLFLANGAPNQPAQAQWAAPSSCRQEPWTMHLALLLLLDWGV